MKRLNISLQFTLDTLSINYKFQIFVLKHQFKPS